MAQEVRLLFIVHVFKTPKPEPVGGAENDGHEIAGHEIDGPSCRA